MKSALTLCAALLLCAGCAMQPVETNVCYQHWDAGNMEERDVYQICQKFRPVDE